MKTYPAPNEVISQPLYCEIVASSNVYQTIIRDYLQYTNQKWDKDLADMAHMDVLSEFAGRVCYQSFGNPRPGGSEAYFDRIKEEMHGSILEHGVVSFIVCGVSRNLTHELVRHRAGFGFSQLSQRYVDASSQKFVPPYDFWDDEQCLRDWFLTCEYAVNKYMLIVYRMTNSNQWSKLTPTDKRKHIRQAARSVLPGSAETHIVVTANLRAWRHFLAARGGPAADTEIRMLAIAIYEQLKDTVPIIMSDISLIETDDGVGGLNVKYRKI